MGVAIKCILERPIPGIPSMEGKSLAMGYCSDAAGGGEVDADTNADIIAIDFKTGKTKTPSPAAPSADESLFAPLDPFIAGDRGVEWHDAAKGLSVVRDVLTKLRNGATVPVTPDFEFCDDEEELTVGVRNDLETLEQTLAAAQKANTRFCLTFDV
jgi:hypothetical protein